MQGAERLVIFEKDFAPDARVIISGVPATVRSGAGADRHYFRREVGAKIERLLRIARARYAFGETNIRLEYNGPDDSDIKIEFSSNAAAFDGFRAYRHAFDRVSFAFDEMADATSTIIDRSEKRKFAIFLSFATQYQDVARINALRNAIVHLGSMGTPIDADDDMLTAVFSLVPHRSTPYDCVRFWFSPKSSVDLTESSRALVLESMLLARRNMNRNVELEYMSGVLQSVNAKYILLSFSSKSRKSAKLRYHPTLGVISSNYLGQNVRLTCIVEDSPRRRRNVEVVEVDPIS